ncbi:hypothetical protein O1611_g8129 [Lasiodiplodia mahajangana]|uniref:Uncharacterized protein n=1 Tax=Lasiodiplodia mahajangana TaxID=1108764 RepID=A0ACC2JDF8_9PEZI|nr:hypothetical protein O1611_g8129 [Lasiodiplodia mahajangana]
MPLNKKLHHKPTRHQPRRATRVTKRADEPGAGDIIPHLSTNGVHKSEGKSRGPAQRKRKKLQNALIKRVDARDPKDALAEQTHLLGLSYLLSPVSPKSTAPLKPREQLRRKSKGEKKYMDDVLTVDDSFEDELQRGDRWIPNFEYRTRPTHKPNGVPYSLWLSYKHLDDFIYRCSLSPEDLEGLPLLEDVHEYQNSDGRMPRPITPPGFKYDESLELVPIEI